MLIPNVTPLAATIGIDLKKKPYTAHNVMPMEKSTYIKSDRSFVCFVLCAFMTCGKNEMVVNKAAVVPIIKT